MMDKKSVVGRMPTGMMVVWRLLERHASYPSSDDDEETAFEEKETLVSKMLPPSLHDQQCVHHEDRRSEFCWCWS